MRPKLSKDEVVRISHLQSWLDDMRNDIEENDVELNHGNGTASYQLSCAVAALECILQEYD